jgi:hypothetical protein
MIRTGLAALALCAALPAAAAPQWFRAEYEVHVNGKPAGESVIELIPSAAGRWQYRIHATGTRGLARFARFSTAQIASVDFPDGRPRLLSAEMQSRSLLRDRDVQLEIDWESAQVRWMGDIQQDEPTQRPLDGRPATGSSLNLQLAFDARTATPGQRVDYVLHDRGRRRDLDYMAGQPETVEVPAGRFTAIPMRGERKDKQRVTIAWYDPTLPPTPVRVLQTEQGEQKYELRLRSLTPEPPAR